jgi:hypothetical protein
MILFCPMLVRCFDPAVRALTLQKCCVYDVRHDCRPTLPCMWGVVWNCRTDVSCVYHYYSWPLYHLTLTKRIGCTSYRKIVRTSVSLQIMVRESMEPIPHTCCMLFISLWCCTHSRDVSRWYCFSRMIVGCRQQISVRKTFITISLKVERMG